MSEIKQFKINGLDHPLHIDPVNGEIGDCIEESRFPHDLPRGSALTTSPMNEGVEFNLEFNVGFNIGLNVEFKGNA
ncbi:MAG: hypothetical protein KUG79_10655 [Pseudomonadales bacterium]|nr:hypothetical protein [Pseudomonadales bacterium]